MESILFAIYAIAACGGAIAVVLTQSVVRMAFWLVISLGALAGLFFLLHADFVGAAQLLIYVGGTVVLLIFGVMLTASGPYQSIKSSPAEILQAALIGGALFAVLAATVLKVDWIGNDDQLVAAYGPAASFEKGYYEGGEGSTVRKIGTALLGVRFDRDLGRSDEQVSTGYLLPFEIISIHLLVVLIGAAYLARAKRRVEPTE